MNMFIDIADIYLKSGRGGNGSVSFRREKYVPLGGPDGGDGGKGGDVIFEVDPDMTTLLDFKYKRKYIAEDGIGGGASRCYGRAGENLVIKVPMGTVIKDKETGKIIADLSKRDSRITVLRGGRGGKGNAKFATPTRQAPDFAEPGMPAEDRTVTLELKLLADVGLLGFPNVGKSTLLSKVTKATPKIANYHFTTLTPNLGVVSLAGINPFVIADIPGLIEGAAEGVGLGIAFLRHIERTRLLVHVIDISGLEGRDPYEDFLMINEELKKYDERLASRPQIIAMNKSDLVYEDSIFEDFAEKVAKLGYTDIYRISGATGAGVDDLLKACAKKLSEIPVEETLYTLDDFFIPEEKHFTYEINVDEDGVFVVSGSFVDRLLDVVNVENPDSLRYFHKVLKNKGVLDKLREMGIGDGDIVRLNNFEFEFYV
ncbi:GTP-binding protein [Youngiibacter multivorans]|uniref:GTPase Obg n=2 Tax=Youngiibacter multivorans TaxID=937251 RepID=A0ABS4G4S7_9CLOT|nr:GTP-binding protein [Youngiibacter multivorans]